MKLKDRKYVYALYAAKVLKKVETEQYICRGGLCYLYLNTSFPIKQPIWKAIYKTIRYNRWYHSMRSTVFSTIKQHDLIGEMNPSVIMFPNLFVAIFVNVIACPFLIWKEAKRGIYLTRNPERKLGNDGWFSSPVFHKIAKIKVEPS